MVEFKKKKGESFEAFLRRFNKRLQQSGKLLLARRSRYFTKEPNSRQKKTSALIGLKLKSKNEYLRKVGKMKDDSMSKW